MKAKKKLRKAAKVKDLAPTTRRTQAVKGGAIATTRLSTPAPPGPIPVPYPN